MRATHRNGGVSRRNVLKGATLFGAGLVIGFTLPARGAFAQAAPPAAKVYPPAAFVHIGPDGAVTVVAKHTEMGQGIYTGLATLIADEMDADWSRVSVVSAPVDAKLYANLQLGVQGTGGSSSTSNSWQQYRKVGATARAMLIAAAAAEWKVPEPEIGVANGVLSHPSGKAADFGQFAEAAAKLPMPENVMLKAPADFHLIGKELRKPDASAKSNGTAHFTIDVHTPGMMTAVVAHAPRFGATVKSFDDSMARQVKGVVDIVQVPRGVAVLAGNTFTARKARDLLHVEWDDSKAEMRGTDQIIADFRKTLDSPGAVAEKKGDSADAISRADKTVEAEYVFPYLSHSPMEPIDCSIDIVDGKYIMRSGTQMPGMDRDRAAQELGIAPDDLKVEVLYAGGGFGRRGNIHPDFDVETASIMKATGMRYPVKLQYTREDDTRAGFYRPLFIHRLRGAVDEKGNITAWENRLVGQSFLEGTPMAGMIRNGLDPMAVEGAFDLPYGVPNVMVDYRLAQAGVPTLFWRSVGNTHTGYSKETFMDELLTAAGKDAVEGRLAMMEDERAKVVLQRAADAGGWGKAPPDGRAMGVAYVECFNTRVAEVVEVSLDRQGRPRLDKVTVAVDCGTAVNPNIIRAQVESAIVYGLTAALYGEIRMVDGVVETRNFDTYRLVRMNQMPKVEVHIIDSHEAPTGIGEPGLPPLAPAMANAAFKLTGKRLRRLPFERLQV